VAPALRNELKRVIGELKAKGASDESIAALKAITLEIAQENIDSEESQQKAISSLESRLRQAVTDFENGIETLRTEVGTLSKASQARQVTPRKQSTRNSWFSAFLYPAGVLIVVGLTAALVAQNRATQPTVAINYDVGAIIQGALTGIGALVAGGAYAAKILSSEQA
jgi:anti-sigma-K factor RskA